MDRRSRQRLGLPAVGTSSSTSNVQNVAQRTQDLIDALSQNVRPNPALDNEMSSSFGFLPKKSFLGKRKLLQSPKAGPATPRWKPFSFYLHLLNKNAETTPTPEEEFKLAQAGLGKRYINVSKEMSHDEFSILLKNEYPKMWELTGGYYLYKSTGGQGRRKLIMISPDFNEGYTGTLIRSVTGGGKNTIYAVPLQHEFDLTPLAPDALEFLHTPKEQCKTCKVTYPLQILALHVQQCVETLSSEEDYEDYDDYDDETSAAPLHHETVAPLDTKTSVEEVQAVQTVQAVQKVPCPICFMQFSPHLLEIHASMCGVRYLHGKEVVGNNIDVQKPAVGHDCREEQIKSVDEVLDTISSRVDGEKHFKVQISRTSIVERGLLQWQRQKKNSPAATLYVTFFGEAGVDSGALRKEFLTEMVAGIESRFFEGPQNRRIPRYSLTDYDRGLFRTVGEILAVSLAQGGPSPAFLSPWTYNYLCSGQMNAMDLNRSVVADAQSQALIDKVESSTEESIKDQDLIDEIYNRGFTGSVSLENKESIVRSLILHASLRLQPMLDELTEGLKLYGLLEIIRKYPDICRPLFVPGEDIKVNAEFFMESIRPKLSEEGTNRHQVEMKMIDFLQDFLHEAEAEDQGHADDMEEPSPITPARLLQWITGQGHIPLLPSEKKDFGVVIDFNHDCATEFKEHTVCFPVVSACARTITLPVKHMSSSEQFKAVLTEAFYLGQEFSSV